MINKMRGMIEIRKKDLDDAGYLLLDTRCLILDVVIAHHNISEFLTLEKSGSKSLKFDPNAARSEQRKANSLFLAICPQ